VGAASAQQGGGRRSPGRPLTPPGGAPLSAHTTADADAAVPRKAVPRPSESSSSSSRGHRDAKRPWGEDSLSDLEANSGHATGPTGVPPAAVQGHTPPGNQLAPTPE
jgi:hypothetical protein